MRSNAVVVFVGRPLTGKTYFINQLLDQEQKKVLIYDLNNEPKYRHFPKMTVDKIPYWKSGKYRVFTPDADELLEAIQKDVRNATIVLEDATSYITANTTRILRKILVSRRHWNLDIFLTFHSLNLVPPVVFELCNYVVVKKTHDSEKKLAKIDKIPNPEQLLKAWQKVMKDKNEFKQITVQTHA